MTLVNKVTLFTALLALPILGNAAAANIVAEQRLVQMDQRLQRLEAVLQNQVLTDLQQQIESVRADLQALRGELEVQRNDIEGIKKRQKDLYLDIDRRLNDLQLGGGQTSAPPTTDAVTPATPITPVTPITPGMPISSTGGVPPVPIEGSVSVDPAQEKADYQSAFNLLRNGRYDQAIAGFQAFLKKYPNGKLIDNAQYWLGEANYVSKNFNQAIKEFTTVIEKYPQSSKIADTRLKLGYTYYEMQQWDNARQYLNMVVQQHAASSVAPLAEKRLLRMTQEGH
ncbi:MAG: tol-pal system protein YbgF [Gammaproteobacteria bacterium]|nr:tol-pal system protein YbgF [Gammaproteobacteria bacterium]